MDVRSIFFFIDFEQISTKLGLLVAILAPSFYYIYMSNTYSVFRNLILSFGIKTGAKLTYIIQN